MIATSQQQVAQEALVAAQKVVAALDAESPQVAAAQAVVTAAKEALDASNTAVVEALASGGLSLVPIAFYILLLNCHCGCWNGVSPGR